MDTRMIVDAETWFLNVDTNKFIRKEVINFPIEGVTKNQRQFNMKPIFLVLWITCLSRYCVEAGSCTVHWLEFDCVYNSGYCFPSYVASRSSDCTGNWNVECRGNERVLVTDIDPGDFLDCNLDTRVLENLEGTISCSSNTGLGVKCTKSYFGEYCNKNGKPSIQYDYNYTDTLLSCDSPVNSDIPSISPSTGSIHSASPTSRLHQSLSPSAGPSPSPSLVIGGATPSTSPTAGLRKSATPSIEPSSSPSSIGGATPSTSPTAGLRKSATPSIEPSSSPSSFEGASPTTSPTAVLLKFSTSSMGPSLFPSPTDGASPSRSPSIEPKTTASPSAGPVAIPVIHVSSNDEVSTRWTIIGGVAGIGAVAIAVLSLCECCGKKRVH